MWTCAAGAAAASPNAAATAYEVLDVHLTISVDISCVFTGFAEVCGDLYEVLDVDGAVSVNIGCERRWLPRVRHPTIGQRGRCRPQLPLASSVSIRAERYATNITVRISHECVFQGASSDIPQSDNGVVVPSAYHLR